MKKNKVLLLGIVCMLGVSTLLYGCGSSTSSDDGGLVNKLISESTAEERATSEREELLGTTIFIACDFDMKIKASGDINSVKTYYKLTNYGDGKRCCFTYCDNYNSDNKTGTYITCDFTVDEWDEVMEMVCKDEITPREYVSDDCNRIIYDTVDYALLLNGSAANVYTTENMDNVIAKLEKMKEYASDSSFSSHSDLDLYETMQ